MTAAKSWWRAVAELRGIPDEAGADTVRRRDYAMAMTFYQMRRRYEDAGRILLGLYEKMGSEADEALFHGARALSRADLDEEAIRWYQKLVARYPRSKWAAEAQFLSGWLKFNLGKYREGIPYLEVVSKRFRRSKWAASAEWYLALSHFLLEDYRAALPYFDRLARRRGRLEGGRGAYWAARTRWLLGDKKAANNAYRELVGRYPFSWYALLARSRLARQKIDIGPLGDDPSAASVPEIAASVPPSLASDPLIRGADELIGAGLGAEAGIELRRGERAFIRRHSRPEAFATLLDRYRRAGNFNRPWMLAVVHGGRALDMPPQGAARIWWEHAYPRAYRELVEKHSEGTAASPYYIYSIMRKESGFNPHVQSYANAIGLLQMIPRTTRQVVRELGLRYTPDLLFDPELNVRTGAWYITRLLAKFKGQIPYGAGSFNSGPSPIMKWMGKFKGQSADVFGELASFSQTREYMKKVTETYARYLYLYEGEIYELPLEIDADYVENELTY
jgi:soluble lytic murein transglycosylase